MSLVRVSISIVLVLLAGGCATGDRVAGHDTVNAVNADFLCEREYRAAREQPIAAGASGAEARAIRGQHVSARCSRAWREANEIRVPLNPSRLPAPVPRPGRSGA